MERDSASPLGAEPTRRQEDLAVAGWLNGRLSKGGSKVIGAWKEVCVCEAAELWVSGRRTW